jgi:hypothetical protein
MALRQQLLVLNRTVKRPKRRRRDRLFLVSLSKLWGGWREALIIVKPDPVINRINQYMLDSCVRWIFYLFRERMLHP